MGPVEIVFLVVMAIFGVIGIVRGFHRELGVTLLLMVALSLILMGQHFLGPQINKFFAALGGADSAATTEAIFYTIFLIIVVFISYQGEILRFPGTSANPVLSWLIGLLNGWLFAGTIWYYWNLAGWPFGLIVPPFTATYQALVKILPPAVLPWWFYVLMVFLMLILRVLP